MRLLTNVKMSDYRVRSNHQSGYGRYDVVLEPNDPGAPEANQDESEKPHDPVNIRADAGNERAK